LKKLNKGFTLIELLVVIAIVGVLSAAIIPKLIKEMRKATVAKVQHNLGVIRSKLSIDSNLSDEFPDLAGENNTTTVGKDDPDLLRSYSIESTPGFTDEDGGGHKESSEVVSSRDDNGGWYYIKETGEIYANLPNGAYTKDEEYEIWNDDSDDDSIVYYFSGTDDLSGDFTNWDLNNEGTMMTSPTSGLFYIDNPYSEYSIVTTATLTAESRGYGIFIQSDETGGGYIFQFDKGLNDLVIRSRNSTGGEYGATYLDTSEIDMNSEDWWTSSHDIEINVTESTATTNNVEILIDGVVITGDSYEINKSTDSDADNYTGFRTWGTSMAADELSITEL